MPTIRSITHRTKVWNPGQQARQEIRYVDVSAVSREKLRIGAIEPIHAVTAPSRARKLIEADDTIIATIRPGLKRIAKVPPALDGEVASTAFCVLRPDRTIVDPDYLFYAVASDDFIAGLAVHETGASYPAIRDQDVLDSEVPLPSLDVQRRIAILLNAVRASLLQQFDLIDVAERLKAACMDVVFSRGLRGETQKETEIGSVPLSWDVVPFSNVREWLQYGTSTRCSTDTASYAVLRIPNIGSGAVIPEDLKYCDMLAAEAAKYRLELGDLIFIRTNGVLERLGSCAVYRGAPQQALFASYLIRARLDLTRVEPRFVAHFYGSKLGTSLVAGRATPASDGKYNLNTGTIDALPLPVPPTLDEQVEIADILDTMDAKIALHQQKRAVLEELFKALLHKLMTGEIDVNDLDLNALQPTT